MEKRQFTVYGRVQGVAFRFYTLLQARKLGVGGYVKNLSDGSVFTVIEGSTEQLNAMREWLQQGSPSAKVSRVVEQPYLGDRKFSGFAIEH
ncbi:MULTISPECIES: acylphosphatase [unclassified Lonepinella]|uniref:acylphosphatase n=1 Tax=unclassified Lonepinella TaxID=2642006 RepID=UPI0036DAAB12